VQLVDEEHDLALGLGDLLEDGLQPVLELAAVLGARDEGPEIEGHDPLVLERLGDVALDDALGEALDDRGLADAGLADQHGVVLGAAREHLDDAAHLVVAPDHRVELALAGRVGEVPPVLLEGLVAVLGVRVVDGLVAADVLEHLEEGSRAAPCALERLGGRRPRVEQGEQQVLGRDVLVLERLRLAQACFRTRVELRGDVGGAAVRLRQGGEAPLDVGGEAAEVRAELAERRRDDAPLLAEERLQEVLGRHLRVVALLRQGLGGGQGLLGLHRELVETHGLCRSFTSARIGN
jgi:hypothetical protein